MNRENLLIVADSVHDADMLFALGMFVPDPCIFMRLRGKSFVLMSDLEIDRAKRLVRRCRVLSLTGYLRKARSAGFKSPNLAHAAAVLLREQSIRKIFTPGNFPFGLARELHELGFKLKPAKGSLFPERQFKTAEQVKKISAALLMAEVGLAEGIQALKRAKIGRNGRLIQGSSPLTSEKLRSIIDTAILQVGGIPCQTIVAGGKQGCDPHEIGYGPLRANQPIILDVFPRSQKTGYFGDITRTVVKGRASSAVRKLFNTVTEAQTAAIEAIRPKTSAASIHQRVETVFEAHGFKTGKQKGRMHGFFHGTGHGLGLELHEAPRLNKTTEDRLEVGQVITVEPGLYYPKFGGVRIEDVVVVTPKGSRVLTRFEKTLEL